MSVLKWFADSLWGRQMPEAILASALPSRASLIHPAWRLPISNNRAWGCIHCELQGTTNSQCKVLHWCSISRHSDMLTYWSLPRSRSQLWVGATVPVIHWNQISSRLRQEYDSSSRFFPIDLPSLTSYPRATESSWVLQLDFISMHYLRTNFSRKHPPPSTHGPLPISKNDPCDL